MPADLYWDWLKVPREKRPVNFFDLLGLSAGVEDVAAIEQAAKRQVERVKQHLDGPQAAEGAKLLQEIAAARATLIDPAKRGKYLASLLSPGGAVQPWWQDPSKRPAAKVAEKPAAAVQPKRLAAPPIVNPKSSTFSGMHVSPGRRSDRSAGSKTVLFALLSGGGLVLVAAIAVAFVIFNSNKPQPTEQVRATEKTNNSPPTLPIQNGTPTNGAENHEPTKSMFLTEADPKSDDSGTPAQPMKYERHTGLVQAVALAPHGRRFLSGGEGGVFEWDRPSGKSFLRHQFKVPASAVCYLPGARLAACADEGSVLVIDLSTNKVKATLKNPSGQLLAMAGGADGKHLLTGGSDGSLRWWDIDKAEPQKAIDLGDSVQIHSLAISRDGKFAAVGCNDGNVGVWELPSLKKVWQTKRHQGTVTGVAFSPDGSRVASASIDKSIAVFQSESGKGVAMFPGHQGGALCVAFLEKSPGLVSGGRDGSLKFWSFESGYAVRSVSLSGPILCLAVAPTDGYVIAGGSAGMLQMLPMPELEFGSVVKDEPPAKKLAIPAAEEIEAASTMLRAKYMAELDQAKPDDLLALAEQLLTKAGSKIQSPQRLALFQMARDLFVRLGKLDSAFKAIEESGRWFEIDEFAEKAKSLAPIITAAPPTGQKPIFEAAEKLLRRAESESRPDLSKLILTAMEQSSEKSGSAELTKQVAAIKKQREQDAALAAKLNELQTKLKAAPDDRDAHLALGLILCSKQNWKDGLAHVAKGPDARLADLAKQDLAEPKEAKPRLKLAQAWADAADKVLEAKRVCYLRAKYWVELAEPNLLAEDKANATLLLGQVAAKISALSPTKEPANGNGEKPKKTLEPVVRRNFNTFRSEATIKSNWKVEGSSRMEALGLRLLDNPVSMQSTFQLIDNWKMEIVAEYDGRQMLIEVNKQTITLTPTRSQPAFYLERKGKKLTYAIASTRGLPTLNTISLPDDALEPSAISIKLEGVPFPNRKDGMLIGRIVVNGPVKVEE